MFVSNTFVSALNESRSLEWKTRKECM